MNELTERQKQTLAAGIAEFESAQRRRRRAAGAVASLAVVAAAAVALVLQARAPTRPALPAYVEIIADEIGPSLRWAQASIERIARDGGTGGGGGNYGGGGGGGGNRTPDPVYGDEEPF